MKYKTKQIGDIGKVSASLVLKKNVGLLKILTKYKATGIICVELNIYGKSVGIRVYDSNCWSRHDTVLTFCLTNAELRRFRSSVILESIGTSNMHVMYLVPPLEKFSK